MFTGIVEGTASVLAATARPGIQGGASGPGAARRLVLDLGPLAAEVRLGDSVAVDGTCLTAVGVGGDQLGDPTLPPSAVAFDVVQETLDRTTLGELAPGRQVNVERPMRADARFHGHIVSGHVDGTGTIRLMRREPGQVRLEVSLDPALSRYLVPKGSITVDGISLTVVDAQRDWFSVALIPHTLEVTTLRLKGEGQRVNLEVDAIGKWVERLLSPWTASRA